ncbi:HNH endonuclease [Streptomyces sp. 147326]|uniref:HNH endonuclease n=1 Tax=Streptomyces sp. 147326 TaxID=3074379 RepID=UPI0038573848
MTSCIDCTEPATHRGRCHTHHQDYERRPVVRTRRSRSRRRAARYDVAARLRRRVHARSSAWCDWCLETYGSDDVDVDHVRPLSLGGEDTDGNVQVLCRDCHHSSPRRSSDQHAGTGTNAAPAPASHAYGLSTSLRWRIRSRSTSRCRCHSCKSSLR